MEKKFLSGFDLKSANRNNIYRTLWLEKRVTKQDLMHTLKLSLPTVTQNLAELCEEGLVSENGSFGNTGGRSAKGYSIIPSARLAVGVDINTTHISVVVVNLNGEIIHSLHKHCHYEKTETYYKQVGQLTCSSIEASGIKDEQLLGIGISVQGLVSEERTKVTYGPILGNTGESVQNIAAFIPYKCELFHDADSAAFAELWASPELKDAIYISLSTNLGGSIIIGRKIFTGANFSAGKIEHMTLIPKGKKCYCGELGCAEAYCSIYHLTKDIDDGKLSSFFDRLKKSDLLAKARFEEYLDNLSILLNSLHMFMDTNIILGGYMGQYIACYIDELKARVYARNSINKQEDYILPARFQAEPIAAGAALRYVDNFLKKV